MKYELVSYTITSQHDLIDSKYKVPESLRLQMERYHQIAMKGKRSGVTIILKAIKKYPRVPQLKNLLSVLYGQLKNDDKRYAVNRWLLREHPDYLFGRIGVAGELIEKEQLDKVPEILGESMNLKHLFPERSVFHINEALTYEAMVAKYYVGIENLEDAEKRLEIIKEIDPYSAHADMVENLIFNKTMEMAAIRRAKQLEKEIRVTITPETLPKTSEEPSFHHDAIWSLYEHDLRINSEVIEKILVLPRETVIQDLIAVLQDSVMRYEHFQKLAESPDEDTYVDDFLIHAIFLLGELKAEESIDDIFMLLSQDEDFYDFFMGDIFTEHLWEPIYKIIANQKSRAFEFMKKPGVFTYCKSLVTTVFEQALWHNDSRHDEILNWFRETLNYYASMSPDDNIIDSNLIGLMVWSLMDVRAVELLPEIENLYKLEYVSEQICGTLDEVKEGLHQSIDTSRKREIPTMQERYTHIVNTWPGYAEK